MAHVALFHSVQGLRSPELFATERLRHAGHEVIAPDLFGGEAAATIDQGFRLLDRVGWTTVMRRARQALEGVPDDTVLAGVSMGTGVVGDLWPQRPATAGVLLLHATAEVPDNARPNLHIQLHAADPDPFAPPERVAALEAKAKESKAALKVFRYPGAGHFYTDSASPDHHPAAAAQTWARVLRFLSGIADQAPMTGA
ncbi:dienelactone hydrolase family protein [Streptomyces sp. NPDC055089]